jgi:hypothetical protein
MFSENPRYPTCILYSSREVEIKNTTVRSLAVSLTPLQAAFTPLSFILYCTVSVHFERADIKSEVMKHNPKGEYLVTSILGKNATELDSPLTDDIFMPYFP